MEAVATGKSLKTKLTIMLMGVSLSAVLATIVTISAFLIVDMRVSKQQELSVSAAVAADRNRAAVTFLDKKRASENLQIYAHDATMRKACLYDASGALFASYIAPENNEGNNAENNKAACPQSADSAHDEIQNMDKRYMAAIMPVKSGQNTDILDTNVLDIDKFDAEISGTVYLLSDTRDISAYIQKIIQISTTVTALVLAITLILAIYIQRKISQPILALATLAQKIASTRDFSLDMHSTHTDEIGALAVAFNTMLKEVRQRDMELRYVNETLEHKVLLRTKELEEAKQLAEKANEAKTEFLRNISHEFRTPLHAMISFSTYGIKEANNIDQHARTRYFQIILKSSERLSRLVDDVMDIARYEKCTQQFHLRRADMAELMKRAADSMRPLLQEKNMQLNIESNADDTQLVCDQDRIMQVLTNIIGNAVKFSPHHSTLTLYCHTEHLGGEPALSIACSDQGLGIPNQETELIFEPFRQSSATHNGAGGTGLGLSICKNIIHAHKGEIAASNNTEAGATIRFILPTTLSEGSHKTTFKPSEVTHGNAA